MMRLSTKSDMAMLQFTRDNHLVLLVSGLEWVSRISLLTRVKDNMICEEGGLPVL